MPAPCILVGWRLWLITAALSVSCARTLTNPSDDAGQAADTPGDGGTDAGDAQGDGGRPGPDGGADAGVTSLAELCRLSAAGFREELYRQKAACEVPITRGDVPHLNFVESVSPPFTVPFARAYGGSSCDVDGGLSRQMSRYEAAIAAGRLGYDHQRALACQALGRVDGGPATNLDPSGQLIEPCRSVFTPKVEAGGACEADYECVGDQYCKGASDGTCAGTCQARLPLGSPCSPVRDQCVAAGTCALGPDAGFACVQKPGAGEHCAPAAARPCRDGFVCMGQEADAGCVSLVGLGQVCKRLSDAHNCLEGLCVTNGTESGRCLSSGVAGDRCGSGLDGLPPCSACLRCGDGGTCALFGRPGDSCASDADCLDTQALYCRAGSCAVRPRRGEPCIAGLDGTDGTCMYNDDFCSKLAPGDAGAAGICAPLPGLGQPCGQAFNRSSRCTEGYCKGDAGTCASFAPNGELCTTANVFGISPSCVDPAAFCDTRPDAGLVGPGVGRCRARSGLGQGCAANAPCAEGLFCDLTGSGVCARPLDNNAPCARREQCASGRCQLDAGVCLPMLPDGQGCFENGDCASSVCDPHTKRCTSQCVPVEPNAEGCMQFDLFSLSRYLFFALLAPLLLRRPRARRAS